MDNVGAFSSLELDAAGNPVVAYRDVTNEDVKVIHCGDATCSAGNVIASPDGPGNIGAHMSLKLDASGFPVASYYDVSNSDLKVLHCVSATCGAAATVSPTPTLSPPSPSPTTMPSETETIAGAAAGDSEIDVASAAGFNVGDFISINPGGTNEEIKGITGFGSFLLDSPLDFDHDVGEPIILTTEPTPTATATPFAQQAVWADNNCSVAVDPVDSLITLRSDAGLSTDTGDCPLFGQIIDVQDASLHLWGDVDCSGEVSPVDSLKILRFDAGLSVSQGVDCPGMGSDVKLVFDFT